MKFVEVLQFAYMQVPLNPPCIRSLIPAIIYYQNIPIILNRKCKDVTNYSIKSFTHLI